MRETEDLDAAATPATPEQATPAEPGPDNAAAPAGLAHDNAAEEASYRTDAHTRLAQQSRVVLRLGQMLLSVGASAYRVKAAMADTARAVGISEHHAQVTYTEIVATAYANGTFRTELAEQRAMGINADRIDRIVNYVSSIQGTSVRVEEVDAQLDEIERIGPLYDWFPNAAASGLACAAFSFLNSGGWVECSAVAVAAFFGQALRRQMLHRRMNHFGVWMACGALAALIYILLVAPAQHFLGLEPTHQAGFISAMLFLVPGFPLVTGLIDLVRQDYLGGLGRIVYVSMLVVSAGVATWAVSAIFHWSVTPQYAYELPLGLLYPLRFLTSFVAAYGFAMLFNSPHKVCAAGATIGAVINTSRLALVGFLGLANPAAVGLAALGAGLLADLVARHTRFSRVTLSVPAVVIMIPGVPLYRSLTYLNNGQTVEALTALSTVLFTIVAIGIGLSVARMLTDKNWLMETPSTVPHMRDLD